VFGRMRDRSTHIVGCAALVARTRREHPPFTAGVGPSLGPRLLDAANRSRVSTSKALPGLPWAQVVACAKSDRHACDSRPTRDSQSEVVASTQARTCEDGTVKSTTQKPRSGEPSRAA
jgi:hypothetical protein